MSDDASRVQRRMGTSDLIHHSSTENEQNTAYVRCSASHEVCFHCKKHNQGFTGQTNFRQHRAEVSSPLIHIIIALKRIEKVREQDTRKSLYH